MTVVIPAFNEERTIGTVVETARGAGSLVREILVVDDGSSDATVSRAVGAGARVIRLGSNFGKTRALLAGVQEATEEYLLFLDADLLGLKPDHLKRLALPVLEGRADMTIGVFRDGRFATDLAQLIAPQLSGQRGLSRQLFLMAARHAVPGFAAEVALNTFARRQGLTVTKVALEGVSHVTKEQKRGLWPGLQARMRMYRDIWRGLT